MRRYLALLTVLVGGGAALVVAAPATASNAAVHINNSGSCGLLDGNGGFAYATADMTVITHSGTANVVCKANVTPSSAGGSVTFNLANTGFLCSTLNGDVTSNWSKTVSASGNATLSCHASS